MSDFKRVSLRLSLLSVVAGGMVLTAVAAHADGGFIDEFRVGVYEHDASILGHQKEKGEDAGAEILFMPLSLLWGARPIIGFLANSAGETNQAYVGVTWTWDFLQNVLNDGDGFYVEGTLGGGVNDGLISAPASETQTRKSLGSNVLFREDVDFGYHITPHWSVAVSYNHISDADLAKRNEGLNDIGVRLGYKF